MKRLAIAAALTLLAPAASAQDPLFVRTTDSVCWFDGISKYRITWTEHHLAFNQTTGLYYVETGCVDEAFGAGSTQQAIRTYTAAIMADPCADVAEVTMEIGNPNSYDTGCGSWQPPLGITVGPVAMVDVPGRGIQLNPQGGPGGVGISYQVEWLNSYDYRVIATASGPNSGGSSVVVEQGNLLNPVFGQSCTKCAALIPDDDPPPPPPPPPPVPPHHGGGGPNGETGPDYPGGPDNPAGVVCCQFADGTNQEMSYQQCADQGGEFWYPAPCDDPIGCCSFVDPSTGEFTQASVTHAECVTLEGTWVPEPCEDGCAECCEAIRALLESFTDDVQEPLRNWLLEDWPDFSTRVLAVLEATPDPTDPTIDPLEEKSFEPEAEEALTGLEVPETTPTAEGWEFDVLGTQATLEVSLDPRAWPDTGFYPLLKSAIFLVRIALVVGLTIQFVTMAARVWRQW